LEYCRGALGCRYRPSARLVFVSTGTISAGLQTMAKNIHEFRDPVHVFVRLDSDERKVVDSRLFQRLRHIHQLSLTYLVYPGATHKRFEHSLGVMELASRIFDVVTDRRKLSDPVRELIPEVDQHDVLTYWRRVLRMAALCHDIGHLPFSHGAERELLPKGWDHERLTREIILSEEMEQIWRGMTPPLRSDDIAKLAVGPKKASDVTFSNWEAILAEIIVGDAFGADRMDYLLRDSHHIGVVYGSFDHHRLVDTLCILPSAPRDHLEKHDRAEPALGVEEGGIHTAEALLLARYFMYTQVYLHHTRLIYDIHLKDFLKSWLPGKHFPTALHEFQRLTDNDILVALHDASLDKGVSGHDPARCIVRREHFKPLYWRNPKDTGTNPEAGSKIFESAKKEFGEQHVRHARHHEGAGAPDFPVEMNDGRLVSSISHSEVLSRLVPVTAECVFVAREKFSDASEWLAEERDEIIQAEGEQE